MRLSKLILHKDILLIHADIHSNDYIFTVKWKELDNKKGGEWELKSYINNSNGKKDLSQEEIDQLINQINPEWDWEQEQEQMQKAREKDVD
ncbi:hypothetical protein [Gracilibacillus dipsosauri]|uniref:hypothetical protein n=1 Tax=Gracilibacillus dipsosauri TaxID=178340 RepID=UPI00240A3496